MNSPDNIEKRIKSAVIHSNPDVNQAVLKELLQQFDKVETQKPAASLPNIRRQIMKSPITKIAAAAVIIFVAITIITQFGGSIDGAGVAFADVRAAFMAQPWVHLQYDNGTESWYNLKTGGHCHKQLYSYGDSFVYINRTDNLRQRYTPEHGQHIRENRPAIYKDNIIPPYEPKTAWDTIVGHWEKIAEQGGSGYHEVEIKVDTLDDKIAVRFDLYYNDAAGRRLLIKQIWADPQTRLPVKVWESLSLAQREEQNREYITGVFSFPETGPLSIYDLGVPKDLPVVRNYDKIPETSVTDI